MTKLELALIMQIIDNHAKKCSARNYGGTDSVVIDNVFLLKQDIKKHYDEVMKDEN